MKNKHIIFVLIIIIIFFLLFSSVSLQTNYESFHQKIAFCLLTREPNIIWLNFLKTLTDSYDIFVVIDNQNNYSQLKREYPNIQFIQIKDSECEKSGYYNSDYMFKPVVATDRAYYYFNKINTKYDHIWFCEDDVFFQDKNSLLVLDNQYPNADLIVPNIEINKDGKTDGWPHWHDINGLLPLPWAHHIICLTRVSKKLMNKINEFIRIHKKMIYKEILFHTLAIHNHMEIQTPKEMQKIRYPVEWDILDIITYKNNREDFIYHPVKKLDNHVKLRSYDIFATIPL